MTSTAPTPNPECPCIPEPRIHTIAWTGRSLRLLDQRRLPLSVEYVECEDAMQTAAAIRDMAVRGAPAIGIAAAYGIVLAARNHASLEEAERLLAASRPTAVNLRWALHRMGRLWRDGAGVEELEGEARAIHEEDLAQNVLMGELGAARIGTGVGVLTHCNAGALATGGYGTALGVIRAAWTQERIARIYHTETRPWLQGARLTAWEFREEGIPATMIADNAAAHLMEGGLVDWVIVGADRIAANGDVANKIGTYQLAICARAHGVRLMVVAPTGTFDPGLHTGAEIPIEQRPNAELTQFGNCATAPFGTEAYNPVFDVTPAHLVDVIVCERGVIERPSAEKVAPFLTAVGDLSTG